MTALITRLQALTGPDWSLSCEVISLLISVDDADAKDFYGSGKDYTASVDAAIALAERVLPNERVWLNRIAFEGNCQWRASLTGNFTTYSDNAAIALCIAILKAEEASK